MSVGGLAICRKKLRPTIGESSSDEVEIERSMWVVLFLEERRVTKVMNTFAIDFSRGGVLSKLHNGDHPKDLAARYVVLDSTIYRIGADLSINDTNDGLVYPKDVFFCNISSVGGDLICSGWKKGPALNGGKPHPLLVAVNGKIYALAGPKNSPYDDDEKEYPLPSFEVLDPDIGKWEVLDDPPFRSYYFKNGPRIHSHTVVGNTIFIKLSARYPLDAEVTLYSFDADNEMWAVHDSPSASPNLIVDNLRLCEWWYGPDVVGNKMYQCVFRRMGGEPKPFAYDLATKKTAKVYFGDSHLNMHPIHGLTDLMKSIPNSHRYGFLTHLEKNRFCLVVTYSPLGPEELTNHMRVCTFEVAEVEQEDVGLCREKLSKSLQALNVKYQDSAFDDDLWIEFYHWCKVAVDWSPSS